MTHSPNPVRSKWSFVTTPIVTLEARKHSFIALELSADREQTFLAPFAEVFF